VNSLRSGLAHGHIDRRVFNPSFKGGFHDIAATDGALRYSYLLVFSYAQCQCRVQKLATSPAGLELKVLTAGSWRHHRKNPRFPGPMRRSRLSQIHLSPLVPTLAAERKSGTAGHGVGRLFAALQNPAVSDETREAVDRIIIEATPNS